MVLQLTFNDFLRLRGAQGAAIEVLDGKVWITEDGRPNDSFLEPGRSYRVAGPGLVVVGAETTAHFARVQVRKPARLAIERLGSWFFAWLNTFERRRSTELAQSELHRLSDRMLNDIGLRRDQIGEIRASSGDTGARALRAATDRRG
jgi:uncharacterized protein YjiS (DUF1127 family)